MGFHHTASLGVSTTFLLLTITACGGTQTAATSGEAVADSSSESTTQVADNQSTTTQTSEPAQPVIEPATQASSDTIASAPPTQSPSYSAQALNADELALIGSELGASEEVFSEHSFALELPEMGGDVAFVASRAERGNKPFGDLVMRLRSPDGEYQPLVPANQLQNSAWNFWELKAIGFEDVNGDGLGPDIIAIAEYMTGAGPEAAQPFPVVTVQFREAGGFFAADAAIDDQLNSQELSTIAEVREALSQ